MATKILTAHFTTGSVPQTGLTPLIDIFELSESSPTTNPQVVNNGAMIEVGQGWYRYDFSSYDPQKTYVFTIDGGASMTAEERYKVGGNESYITEIADQVWDETATDHTQMGSTGLLLNQIKADVATIAINDVALADYLELLLKYQRNRTKIDLSASQLIIYDDDGVTPLTTFNLLDFNGMPNVQEVCEKVPV